MIIEYDGFVINLYQEKASNELDHLKMHKRAGWSSTYKDKHYGAFVIVLNPDDKAVKEAFEILLDNAYETLLAIRTNRKSIDNWTDEEMKSRRELRNLLDEKLKK